MRSDEPAENRYSIGLAKYLYPYLSIPVADISLDSCKLWRQQHPIVREEITGFLQVIHALPNPMLRGYEIVKILPGSILGGLGGSPDLPARAPGRSANFSSA